jgi:methylated-DNA-[protein]-cysteine S-methyltransferase
MTDAVTATTVASEMGEFVLLEHDDVLVAAGFGTPEEMHARLATTAPLRLTRDLGVFSDAVRAYFAGDVRAVDTLPVQQPGGAFRQAAWKVMRDVPAGETITYTEVAARVGSPLAVRAAGSACARNLIALVVPCHRIVRTDGSLGGYYYGLPTKERLLAHERRSLTRG